MRKRLAEAVEYSKKQMQPYRRNRYDAIRQYVGRNYNDKGSAERVPVNMLELLVSVYSTLLISQNPSVTVSTEYDDYRSWARTLELATQQRIKRTHLATHLERTVREALFSVGVTKVGLRHSGDIEIDGENHEVGESFAKNVGLDDLILDFTARNDEEFQYIGNTARLPYEVVMESKRYSNKESIAPVEDMIAPDGQSRAEEIGASRAGKEWLHQPYDMHELFLPMDRLIVSMAADDSGKIHAVEEWDGPPHKSGPYHFLSFFDVPDSVMPLAPIASTMDLHMLINRIWVKLGRQAVRQKEVIGYRGGAHEDAERAKDAVDGALFQMDDPKGVNAMRFGGVDQLNLAFGINTKNLYSYMAGNLDALGGLQAMSDTGVQDKMLQGAASQRSERMQSRAISHAAAVISDIAWYMWTDPLIEMNVVKTIPGTDIRVPATFSPERIRGDFFDYAFEISPYSMQYRSPGQRSQALLGVFNQLIMPLAANGMLAAQGISIDMTELLDLVSKLQNMPELKQILVFSEGAGGTPAERGPSSSPTTHRIHERINRPGQQGGDAATLQALSGGGGTNPQEMANAMKATK